MNLRFPVCDAKRVQRVLRSAGVGKIAQKGSHEKWRHPDGRQVVVPNHGSKTIPIGTLKSIVEGSRVPVDDFR